MRVRLFTLLLVPIAAAMVVAALFVNERGEHYDAAERAFQVAELAEEVASLDKALGEEALAASFLVRSSTPSSRAVGLDRFADSNDATNSELADVAATLAASDFDVELSAAAETVAATLTFRGDVADGLISPLQVLDRYSFIRGQLIDALASEALTLETAEGQHHIVALVDLIEVRSAHLDERVAVDLARRYEGWAPGLHSAVVASVANQNANLDNANRFLLGDEVEPPGLLTSWRTQISVAEEAPPVSARVWAGLSDAWLNEMDSEVADHLARTMDYLAGELSAAEEARFAAILGVSAAVLAAMLIASIVSVSLVRRLSIITQQARRMAAGLETRRTSPEVRGSDELGQLAGAFDEMISQIETRTTNQWLESTVLESIAHGESFEMVLELAAPLLGTNEHGESFHRFVTNATGDIMVEATGAASETATPATEAFPIEQLPDTPEARTVLGLVRTARQRDDDHIQLAWQATRDELTGLFNRGAILAEALEIECTDSGGPQSGLLYVDLDGFKAVNDQFGHAAGDRVLIAQSKRLSDLAAGAGGVVGRLGGDEFLLVVPNMADDEALARFAQVLVNDLARPTPSTSGTFHVTASAGGVMARSGTAPLKLLNDADAALYDAKRLGRQRAVISTQQLRDQILETEQLRKDVLTGLASSEFKPWYQPIWAAGGTTLVGVEALARWEHPDRRLVSPAVFLPVAEELNLLAELDRRIFEAVCRQVVSWQETGYVFDYVHFNLSTAWLEDPDFLADTTRIMAETGCPPEAIVAEVTESGLMTDIGTNSHRLQKLREAGIRIAVDDFGQGYSSLAYLSDLPVDLLKIDRRFVDRVDKEESNQAIVSAIVSLGRSLGLRIVAEGLERPEELEFLTEAGCDLFQGFLLARPTPAAETTAMIARSRQPSTDGLPGGALSIDGLTRTHGQEAVSYTPPRSS